MDVDVAGRVANIKLSHSYALSPLFEAIVNSIDGLAEVQGSEGEINVHIERGHSQTGFPADTVGPVHPVKSFIISDNGVGFTDTNYEAFNTSDTRQKAAQGRKDVGHLLWLKAFDHAEITSAFTGPGGKRYRREFQFRLTSTGIEDHVLIEASTTEIGTRLYLCGYKPEYQQETPRLSEMIARRIIELCLRYFVLGLAPRVLVHDGDSGSVHDLCHMFAEEVSPNRTALISPSGDGSSPFTTFASVPRFKAATNYISVQETGLFCRRILLARSRIFLDHYRTKVDFSPMLGTSPGTILMVQ